MRANVGRWRRRRCNNDKCRVLLKNVDGRGIMDLTRVVVCAEKRWCGVTAGSCFFGRMQENQELREFERGFLYQI